MSKRSVLQRISIVCFILVAISLTQFTYHPRPLWAQIAPEFPIIHMQDTTVTFGSLVYSGRQINAEYVKDTSQLIGDEIDSITIRLKRVGSPSGTAEIGVFNESLSIKKLFGTITTVSTLSTVWQDYDFKLSGTDLYTIKSGDRIGIKYAGGSAGNGINVMIDRNISDPFDGTNSQRIRYESGWLYYDTGEDMYMILKQTHDGSGSDTTPPPPSQSFPTIHMSDTTDTVGIVTYSSRPVHAEYVTASSELVGDKIDSVTLRLKRVGTISGTAEIGVINNDLSVKKLFGALNVATLTPSFTDYEFQLTGGELYTIQSGDRIGIKFTGGDISNNLLVMTDKDSKDPFDYVDSYRTHYADGSWRDYTFYDLYMILKQTPNDVTVPPTQSILNVNAADLTGSAIEDVYVTIAEGNRVLFAGNTPVSYPVKAGTTYNLGTSLEEVLENASYTFDHWDDGSTDRKRTVTPTSQSSTTLTAFYKVNTAGWATVTVNAAALSGDPISGIYVTISPAVRNIASGYTPLAFTLASDTAYILSPQDYGSYAFDHWGDGDKTRVRTITPADPMNLIAHFRTLPSTVETLAPSVIVSSPKSGQMLTSSSPTISGTASDNVGITKVEVSVDGGEFEKASGIVRWSFAMLGLSDGSHSATVRATDAAGNAQTATIDFIVAASPILPKTGVYVPLYVYPSQSNMVHYNTVINAKIAHPSVPIVLTINPAGGPGTSKDFNYANAIDRLQSAGVVVIGYVPTKYGSRDINAVKSDIDKFISWYDIDGIHLDEVANRDGYANYYTQLTEYGRSQGLRIMLGNAGADPPQSYIGTVDSIGITEGSGYMPTAWLQYCVSCSSSGWHYIHDKNNFWFLRYNVETLDTQYVIEASKWVGLLYLTDGVSPVRWDHLPPYFETLVATLDSIP